MEIKLRVASFSIAAFLLFVSSASALQIEGTWQTTVQGSPLQQQLTRLRYVLHIANVNGIIAAKMDVPEHFHFGDSVDSIVFNNSTLKFHVASGSFEGTLSADSTVIKGTWSVGAEKQDVTWQCVTSAPANRLDTVAITLQSLMHLPAEEWKTHTGDVPHGEAVDLDDSSWKTVGPNSKAPYE